MLFLHECTPNWAPILGVKFCVTSRSLFLLTLLYMFAPIQSSTHTDESFPVDLHLDYFQKCDFHFVSQQSEANSDLLDEILNHNQDAGPRTIYSYEESRKMYHNHRKEPKFIMKESCDVNIIVNPNMQQFYHSLNNFRGMRDTSKFLFLHSFKTQQSQYNAIQWIEMYSRYFDAQMMHVMMNSDFGVQMYGRPKLEEHLLKIGDGYTHPTLWSMMWDTKSQFKERGQLLVAQTDIARIKPGECKPMYESIQSTTARCLKVQYAAEILAHKYNFTVRYFNDNSPNIQRTTLDLQNNHAILTYRGLDVNYRFNRKILFEDYLVGHIVYFYEKKAEFSPFLYWVEIGYDKLSWTLIFISYLAFTVYAYLCKFLNGRWVEKKSHCFSWLAGIALLLRQDHTPVSNKIVLQFAFVGWILSVCYECFVKAEETIPFEAQPFQSFSQLIEAGFKYQCLPRDSESSFLLHKMYVKYNLTDRFHDCIEMAGNLDLDKIMDKNLFLQIKRHQFESEQLSKLNYHILSEPLFAKPMHSVLEIRFQNVFARDMAKLDSSGINQFLDEGEDQRYIARTNRFRAMERKAFLERQPMAMKLHVRIYSAFVIVVVLHFAALLTYLAQRCVYHKRSVVNVSKQIVGCLIYTINIVGVVRRSIQKLSVVLRKKNTKIKVFR